MATIAERPGTRFGHTPLPDIGAEMPALHALHLDAYLQLDAIPYRWMRLTVARALAYGRLKGAANAQAYEEFLAVDHRWVWRDRDEDAEPWMAQYRDVPDEQLSLMPFRLSLAVWYSVVPGTRLSPRPMVDEYGGFEDISLSAQRILAMATSVRTVACQGWYLPRDTVFEDTAPRLEKLIITDYSLIDVLDHTPLLARAREISFRDYDFLESLYHATRRGGPLGNVERLTQIYNDGYVRVDRHVFDMLTPEHVDQALLSEISFDSLARATGIAPTFTEHESALINALGAWPQRKNMFTHDELAHLL